MPSGSSPGAAGCTPMRPMRRSPSRCASTSMGTRSDCPARSTVKSSVAPGFGCTTATSAGKSATGAPFTAVIRSPSRRPARSAGLPGMILPTRAGTTGYQKSKPRPGSSAPGSVSARRSPSMASEVRRVSPCSSRTASSMARPFISSSSSASTAASRVPVSRPPTATISSPELSPARAATESAVTSPSTGFSAGMPATNSTQ